MNFDGCRFNRSSQPFYPNLLFGHPSRILNVAKNSQLDFSSVALLAIDDTSDILAKDLSTEVCQIAQVVQSKSRVRLRFILLSQAVPKELRGGLRTLREF